MRALLDALIFLCSDMIMLNSLYRLYGIYFDRSVVNRRKEYLAYGAYWLIHFLNYDLVGLPLFHALGTGVSRLPAQRDGAQGAPRAPARGVRQH